MVVFVENAFALVILKFNARLREDTAWFFVYDRLKPLGAMQILPQSRVRFVSARAIRWLKAGLGLLQLPIVQPDPLGFSYAVNRFKLLISDGLLTEMLVDKQLVQPSVFYSMPDDGNEDVPTSETPLIIGSNWVEHGSMTPAQYVEHLQFMRDRYPRAVYIRHPRELGSTPEHVFGSRHTLRPELPIDLHCFKKGVPEKIIGVCSTSMLALPMMARGRIDVDIVLLDPQHLGGPKAGRLQQVEVKGRPSEVIDITQMQEYLAGKLQGVCRRLELVHQPATKST